jgi:aminopeptidase N/puromycin-sensitive aminopeptidase
MKRGGDDARDARAQRLGILGADAESASVISAAAQACRRYLTRPESLHPAFADIAVSLAAEHGDAALFQRLEKSWRSASTPQQSRRALMAQVGFRDPGLHDRALARSLDPELASGDVAILLVRGLGNPHNPERTWRFIKRNWPALNKRMGGMLVTRVIDATPALGTAEARRDVAAFFEAHPVPTGERAIRQALERFDLAASFRRRAGPELEAWLSGATTGR